MNRNVIVGTPLSPLLVTILAHAWIEIPVGPPTAEIVAVAILAHAWIEIGNLVERNQRLQSSHMHESKINQKKNKILRSVSCGVAILAHARIKMHRGPLFFLLPLVAIFAHTWIKTRNSLWKSQRLWVAIFAHAWIKIVLCPQASERQQSLQSSHMHESKSIRGISAAADTGLQSSHMHESKFPDMDVLRLVIQLQSSRMHESKSLLHVQYRSDESVAILAHAWIEIKNLRPTGRQSELQYSHMHESKSVPWGPRPCQSRYNPCACMNQNGAPIGYLHITMTLQSSHIHELKYLTLWMTFFESIVAILAHAWIKIADNQAILRQM